MNSCFIGISSVLLCFASTNVGHADCRDAAKAKQAYDRGSRALETRDTTLAVTSFEQAYKSCPNPNPLLGIANAQLLAKHFKAATLALDRYVADAGTETDWCAVLDVRRQIALLQGEPAHRLAVNLSPRTARAYIRAAGAATAEAAPGCPVSPDGDTFAVQLPSGNYTVTGLLETQAPRVVIVELTQPGSVDIGFQTEPAALPLVVPNRLPKASELPLLQPQLQVTRQPAPPWYQQAHPWFWIGAGVAGITAAATGIWALSMESKLNRECGAEHFCMESQWSAVDRHDKLATVSTVGFVLAGVGAATGLGLYYWQRRTKDSQSVSSNACRVGLGQLSLNWSY